MTAALGKLLDHPSIWQGRRSPQNNGIPTGHEALDQRLPHGGWCRGALTEILYDHPGCGEVTLLLPALARFSRRQRWIVWISPPALLNPTALQVGGVDLRYSLMVRSRKPEQSLWAAEQAMRSGVCAGVVLWPRQPDPRSVRRLQLAAEAGRCWGVLLRPAPEAALASPAATRLLVRATSDGTHIDILKARGGIPHARSVDLPVSAASCG